MEHIGLFCGGIGLFCRDTGLFSGDAPTGLLEILYQLSVTTFNTLGPLAEVHGSNDGSYVEMQGSFVEKRTGLLEILDQGVVISASESVLKAQGSLSLSFSFTLSLSLSLSLSHTHTHTNTHTRTNTHILFTDSV